VTEFDQMKMLLNGGGMKLGIAIRPMNSPGSPVYNATENVWPPALVLGIDATTAVSSVVKAVVSGPLTYRGPDRFVPAGPFRGGRPAGFVPRMGLLFPRSGCPSRL
jgi:hypothetical protein